MGAVLQVVAGGAPAQGDGFEVAYVDRLGGEHHVDLYDAAAVRFEDCRPVRSFPSWKGQRNYPGLWWSATVGRHVGYESWLERDHAMLLDFDSRVTGYASQPMWLFWMSGGRRRSHAPDWFARRSDGTGLVVDCRPLDRVKPRDAEAFAATERACREIGWEFRLVGAPEAVQLANVRWLSGYRHPRHRVADVVDRLLEVFDRETPLRVGAERVGDPIAVLPVLFHLLWSGGLAADLSVVLGEYALIRRAEAAG
ncbi:TnsA-like heteromeric transposase endonuclease subunit [Streptomyces coeruleorubidus]|uniref:TnsA-like heteromeric transposase endonuclease subunit n=1 Tax=Streptomyces coeruleorubidus TaxID=116188 RepID=UPI0033F59585